MQGAEAVAVSYCPPEPPVLSIEAARERGALYQLPGGFGGCDKASGDAAAAIEAAPLRIRGGSIAVPGVYHMYMEPQNALALPDEGGSLKIYSACQDIDCVQKAVAHSLGMRQHDVEAVCRRAGGGFGGKAMRNLPVAVGAAVAAVRTGRPVRFVQDRRTDMRLNAGRCEVMAEYDVGFTTEGVIEGLHIRAFLLLGAYPDIPCDAMVLNSLMGMAYALPNFSLTSRLCRGNLPPMTAMRAPGDAQAAFIMEQIMEHVATQCGLAAAAVRERNFARLPDPAPEQALAPAAAEGEDAEAKPVADKGEAPVVRLSLGKEIPVGDYTLPRLWEQLKRSCGYEERMAAAQRFNADSPWVKRGLGMTHTRFDCYIASKAAYVSIYPDGSVVVFAGRSELGQGLTTKVLQVALMELSTLLPAASRPLPVSLVRMGDQSSYILPSTNMTGGSTTSESACIAVRQACQQLVERMRPFADKLGPQSTWAELMAAVVPPSGGFGGPKVPLTAYGHVGGDVQYCVFGAACCEAELNVLTGERRLLRCDLAMDVGRSMNPAIDIGQIEGALSMGLGQALSEARRHDPATGRLLTDSLWTYHPPIAASMPQELNVTLLPGSSLERSVLSAKAVGEPPLMLATSALSALQAAARDACAELAALGAIEAPGTTPLIRLPATPESLVAAMGGGARNLAAAFAG